MKIPLRTSAPWILGGLTVALGAAFWLPLGEERLHTTTYQPLANLIATFAASAGIQETSPKSPLEPASPRSRSASHSAHKRAKRAPHASPSAPPHPTNPKPLAPSPLEGIPQPTGPIPAATPAQELSADVIKDAFDAEPSKFPLDAKASAQNVSLRLLGLCRWQGRYIVKVTVANLSGADFFVKELSVSDGPELQTVQWYFRLLVEPGRTREGFVLFDARPGAQVKITLKEDKENGRTISAPVRYPF